MTVLRFFRINRFGIRTAEHAVLKLVQMFRAALTRVTGAATSSECPLCVADFHAAAHAMKWWSETPALEVKVQVLWRYLVGDIGHAQFTERMFFGWRVITFAGRTVWKCSALCAGNGRRIAPAVTLTHIAKGFVSRLQVAHNNVVALGVAQIFNTEHDTNATELVAATITRQTPRANDVNHLTPAGGAVKIRRTLGIFHSSGEIVGELFEFGGVEH